MGGRGSGGHNSKGKLRDVQCARLDVHELAREGKLKLGARGWLFGTIRFEVTGGPDAQQLVLEFPRKSATGQPLDPMREVIGCHWRKTHFGGQTPHLRVQRMQPFSTGPLCSGSPMIASGISPAANALGSFISPRWAIAGTARRAVSKSCAADCSGRRAIPCQSSREACTRRPTTVCWGCLLTTRPCESRGRVTGENTDRINIVLSFGGNAETGSRVMVGGESAP